MATLVSPGVSSYVSDESQYGTSGTGTIPLIVIATAQDKLQPGSSTAIAPGTTSANSGKLWLITGQRDALQTFGNPAYYSSAGTIQQDNELNELGLFTLYEYLGIANQAYVLRADIDLAQLIPTTNEPAGPPLSGQNWLDLSNSTFGLFRSNGNPNPSFSWQAKTPLVINSSTNLEKIVQGYTASKIISGSISCITANGNLVINGVSIALTTGMSISTVASVINSSAALKLQNISALVYSRVEKYTPTSSAYGDVFNLRLVSTNLLQDISLVGSTVSVLTDLGFGSTPDNIILPKSSYGSTGDLAVNTLASNDGVYRNEIWEKILVTTATSSTSYWFKVGSTDTLYPGFGWREAQPNVITGSTSNPVFTATEQMTIAIGSNPTLTVTVPSDGTLSSVVSAINTALNGANENAIATVYSIGNQNYLRIINFNGNNITINDLSDQNGNITPWRDAGILPTNTYWGSVTGKKSSPTFTASTLLTTAATVVAPGTGYNVSNTLTVVGGTSTTATVLSVASVRAVTATATTPGTGYNVNDTITITGASYTSPVVLKVTTVNGSNGITAVSILQAGQYTGVTAPTTGVTQTTTTGSGTGAAFTLAWGVNTVTVSTAGNYTVYPTSPVTTTTSGSGAAATFTLTSGWLDTTAFTVNPGNGAVTVYIPAAPNNTLDGVIAQVNNVSFPNGPIVASKTTDNKLVLTNTNGTSFVVEDLKGTPLANAEIAAGVIYGRSLVYQGYQPSLTVPNTPELTAIGNIWINTTPGNQGANYVVKQYAAGKWRTLNVNPNTGTVPMYDSNNTADAAFGGLKQIGSTYIQYNSDVTTPATASQIIKQWNGNSWVSISYTPSASEPTGTPINGSLWYNTKLRADIMVNIGNHWVGYRNMYPATDINGPILSSQEPTTQSTLASLVDYDIWIDTSNTTYPTIYRYDTLSASWILVDNTDQSTSKGVVFSDARPNSNGLPTGSEVISDMLLSNYVDSDAPDASLYPAGMMLFNTRYSTNNVKIFRKNYLESGTWRDRWVTYSGNQLDGSPWMGKHAQRAVVVRALQGVISSNNEVRAENTNFNLIATPGYIECLDEMITLNVDKKEVAFIVGDTPSTLDPSGTSILNWANNTANAGSNGAKGLISSTPYAALYYPWGLGTDLNGNEVIVPPSLMALRTIAYSDSVSYPWFAPAGFNRGLVTGVTSVGYLSAEGEYVPVTLSQGQRDVLYTNRINPIAYIPGRGLVIYGQKTLNPVSSALDRINVARLINYLQYNLDNVGKPFLFEPNDIQTRQNFTATLDAFMQNLITLRAVYDFSVLCSSENNTPDRIDRNEMWADIAIQPTKVAEMIYIPIRILNTGDPLPNGQQ